MKYKILFYFLSRLIVVYNLLELFALALLLGLSAGEDFLDGPRYQAEGVHADGHGSTNLCLALFLQPVTLVSQLHVGAQLGGHDDDGDRRFFRSQVSGFWHVYARG